MFTDGKDLVILALDGREVFRSPATNLPTNSLATALQRHGFPWRGTGDPHEGEYRRWIDGRPDLDEDTNALLRSRRRALEAEDEAELESLHARLQERGVVVRDRNSRQQYRWMSGHDQEPTS